MVVHSHLGMKGRWRVSPVGIAVAGPAVARAARRRRSRRGSGTARCSGSRTAPTLRLGPDLLADATDPTRSARRIVAVGGTRLLGDALLDQRLVAGIGNMWLAELLWHGAALAVGRRAETSTERGSATALAWG